MKVSAAIDVLLALITVQSRISTLVQLAQAQGREDLLPEEMAAILADDDKARLALVDAIAKAKAEGR